MSKPIKVLNPAPKPICADVVVLPFGLYCNAALLKAKPGQDVVFCFEKSRVKRRLVQCTRFRINSPEFSFVLRAVYGKRGTISKLLDDWEAWAVVEGFGKNGFHRDVCLVLLVEADADNEQ